jgi:hypothetical protein
MKWKIPIFLMVLSSCEGSLLKDTRPACVRAVDHIDVCIGMRPYLEYCNEESGLYILSLPCDQIPSIWR